MALARANEGVARRVEVAVNDLSPCGASAIQAELILWAVVER
ncbi:hypothetical protein [Streptomyces decoyicus]|nr:hypothetical protein OG532_39555 [Streptomyces decoyicus]